MGRGNARKPSTAVASSPLPRRRQETAGIPVILVCKHRGPSPGSFSLVVSVESGGVARVPQIRRCERAGRRRVPGVEEQPVTAPTGTSWPRAVKVRIREVGVVERRSGELARVQRERLGGRFGNRRGGRSGSSSSRCRRTIRIRVTRGSRPPSRGIHLHDCCIRHLGFIFPTSRRIANGGRGL